MRAVIVTTKSDAEYTLAASAARGLCGELDASVVVPVLHDVAELALQQPTFRGARIIPFAEIEGRCAVDTADASFADGNALVVPQASRFAGLARAAAPLLRRHVVALQERAELVDWVTRTPARTVLVAEDLERLDKPLLGALYEIAQRRGLGLGLLTAPSASSLTMFIARMVIAAERARLGAHDALPTRTIEPGDANVYQYYVVHDHGQAQHLRHRATGAAICGALPQHARSDRGFDCEVDCPFSERIRASELRVNDLFLFGCDSVALGDGVVPLDFRMGLSALRGWTAAVVASFRYIPAGPLEAMADALVKSGESLGDIVNTLNATARSDSSPQPRFLLLGDPARAVLPSRRVTTCVTPRGATGELDVELTSGAAPAARIQVDPTGVLAVTSDDPALLATKPWFAFVGGDAGARRVLVFAESGVLPERFAMAVGPRTTRIDAALVRRRIAAITTFITLGFDAATVARLVKGLQMRFAGEAAAPRMIERVMPTTDGETDPTVVFGKARVVLLESLLQMLQTRNLWLPNDRALDTSECGHGECFYCGQPLTRLRAHDPIGIVPDRELLDCGSCGLVGDAPFEASLELRFARPPRLDARRTTMRLWVSNPTTSTVAATVAVQFNAAARNRTTVSPRHWDVSLEPGEQRALDFEVTLVMTGGDDVVAMQAFAISDEFELYNAHVKVPIVRRAVLAQYPELGRGEPSPERWVWSGGGFRREEPLHVEIEKGAAE